MSVAQETAAVVDLLPPSKAQSVLDFAKYLAEQEEGAAWERSFAKAKHSKKFKKLVDDVRLEIADGKSLPMDMDRL
jgi:hypothetical protein